MSDFHEMSRDHPQPKQSEWRTLDPPVKIRGYFANQWHDVVAVDVNEDTREVRVELPVKIGERGLDLISHKVLDASLYEAPPGSF